VSCCRVSASITEARPVLDAETDFLGTELGGEIHTGDLGAGKTRTLEDALVEIDPAQIGAAEETSPKSRPPDRARASRDRGRELAESQRRAGLVLNSATFSSRTKMYGGSWLCRISS
jgi:hypothetical protein